MALPSRLAIATAAHIARQRLRGRRRFPLVLMLEPTFRCNLACVGCGRIREESAVGNRMLSLTECLAAVEETDAPVVSIAGGEPLLHPQIGEIVQQIVDRRRHVHLCTNGIAMRGSLDKFTPGPLFSFVVHLDGLADTHDRIADRQGVFDTAVAGIEAARQAGFMVKTNTTFFKGTDPGEMEQLFLLLSRLGVDGLMVAPAFNYEGVSADIFLSREEVPTVFRPIYEQRGRFAFHHTPIYLEFLAGKRDLRCVPWSTPTRNPRGWKRPCYLLTDGYCDSFAELLEKTSWERYGVGRDPRCANCMVHSGFEASAIDEVGRSLPNLWRAAKWSLLGR